MTYASDTTDTAENLTQNLDPQQVVRTGEYSRNGDFHRHLDPSWSYYPIYINKLEVIDSLLRQYATPQGKTLDAGCGEGVLVEKYRSQGWDIVGFDKNYASPSVIQGDILDIPIDPRTFDQVLCLDVLEHLHYPDQVNALSQIRKVLKGQGLLILSVPNLAHFTSRLKLLFRGKLLRTASIDHHPGDRTACEYEELLQYLSFEVIHREGIFPTIPPIYRFVMKYPSKSVSLLRWLRRFPIPHDWHFQTIFVCRYQGL